MKVKRILSLMLCILMLMTMFPLSGFMTISVNAGTTDVENSSSINIGDCITLGKYNGEPIVWRCVGVDENGPLMLSEKILCFKSFDAKGNHGNYYRNKEGTNNWSNSCLRHWLNSYGVVDWADRPATPSVENVFNGYNPYANELGFLSSFSPNELSAIKAIEQKTYLNALDSKLADGGTSEYAAPWGSFETAFNNVETIGSNKWYQLVTDRFFLLDYEQAAMVYNNLGAEFLLATATVGAVEADTSKLTNINTPYQWWMRTPRTEGMSYENVCVVQPLYKVDCASAFSVLNGNNYQSVGVRPAFYLNVDAWQQMPQLSEDSAAGFIGFLTDNINPQTKDDWKEGEIKATALYQVMTGTYTGEDFDALAESLVMYATAVTSARASKATNNSSFLNKTITEYLEKEVEKHENLDAEIENEYYNAAAKKLTEFFHDTINTLFPVSADSIFSVTDIYGYYSTVAGAPAKAERIAERVAAAIEAGIMVTEYEKAGRYTYFSTYLAQRGGYRSKDDECFRILMAGNRTIISDANWIANIINLFTWLTDKESFNKHFDLMDEWAEYIYQLDCYVKGKNVETNATAIAEDSVQYSVSGMNVTITSANADLSGHVLLPDSIADSAVTKIDSGAFENQTAVESVKLGDAVEVVGSNAFKGCTSMKSVVLTSSVTTIETFAFENCISLETVVLPDGVTFIGENAFAGCSEDLNVVYNCDNAYVTEWCTDNGICYTAVHDFGEYISDGNGNCKSYGTLTATCTDCDATDVITDWNSLSEHVWKGKFEKFPTATEDGEYILTCENCNEKQVKTVAALKFSGASLTLQDNLAVNYKVDAALFEDSGYTNPYVVFELNGVERIVKDYTISGDRYVFTFRNIAPNQMNDVISATLYATYDGEVYSSATREYSVAEYCYSMLELYSGDEYAELRTLLVDLLNYGAVSQQYTDYNVSSLVNASLTEEQKVWASSEDPLLGTVLNTAYEVVENPTATWKGAGLALNEAVSVRLKFTAEDVDGLTVKVRTDTDEWTISSDKFLEEDGVYYVYFNGLHAGQMRETLYLTIYNGDTAVSNTACYSIESYAYEKQASSIDYLADLVKAMMKYGDSAYAYAN